MATFRTWNEVGHFCHRLKRAGGVGVVTVSGADGSGNASTWSFRQDLNIGYPGTGTLNVEAGGHVAVGGRMDAGVAGQGKMELSDGATLSSNDGVVGTDAYGEAILTSGASWTMGGQLTVGLVAQGDLRIEDGASVTSNQGYVGAHPGSDGSVTVTGPGSSWEMTSFNLTLGNYGVGTMTIEDGARVYANAGVYLGISDATASGTLNALGTPGARGVLETSGLRGGTGTANVTVDGGIVRAIRNNTNFISSYGTQQVTLGAGGGIIDTNGYNIGIATVMTGAGSLTKDGLGTLTLTGANIYGGGTTITAGTLQLGNGGTSGSIVGNVANSGVLAFNRSDAVTFGGTIAGTGGVWQVGSGQTTLSANSSVLSGVSRVYNGILSVNGTLGGSIEAIGGRLQGTGQVGTATNFVWGRIVGRHASMDSKFSTTGADLDVGIWQLQAGADQQLYAGEAGNLVEGLSARYGTIAGNVTSVFGNGSISGTGYGLGGSLNWYGSGGFYLDAQANLTGYDSALASSTAGTGLVSGNGGFGYAMGVEAGQQVALNQNWSITPQAQLTYSDVSYNGFTDVFGAAVSLAEGNDLTIRLGLSAEYQNSWTDEIGQASRIHAYGIANLYYDVLPQSRTNLAGVELINTQDNLWGGVGIGGTYTWGDEKYAIHGQTGVNTSLVNFGSSYSLTGTAGLAVRF